MRFDRDWLMRHQESQHLVRYERLYKEYWNLESANGNISLLKSSRQQWPQTGVTALPER